MTWESTVEVAETAVERLFASGDVGARVRRSGGEWLLTLPPDPALDDAGPYRAYASETEACDAARRIVQACVAARDLRREADRAVLTAFRVAAGNPRWTAPAEAVSP